MRMKPAPAASRRRPPFVARDAPARPVPPAPARARKAPTNLSLPADLVRRARALGLNLSQVVERALAAAIREAEQGRWLAENDQAIDQYNAFVERHGVFGDGDRGF
jgi:antitoxin CcdA